MQAALRARDLPPARVIAWDDLLACRVDLAAAVPPGSLLRIESPGRNPTVERALLARGALAASAEGSPGIDRESALRLPVDRGRILYPRQWYLGFRSLLAEIADRLDGTVAFTSHPDDIAEMFDKRLCHARLQAAGVRVPRALPPAGGYEELRSRMREAGLHRVFVKLNHGSSASGVVALATAPGKQLAWTTVEMMGDRLYNSRRLRRYETAAGVAALIDALAPHGVHTEAWVPKAGIDGAVCDLRVVTVGGHPEQAVLRLSRGPVTNLHLRNRRADPDLLRSRMPAGAWESLRATCRQVAAQYPRTLHLGIDCAVRTGFRDHAILEVNAFGDLLYGVTEDGRDTYASEVACLTSAA